jgi:nucleoside 2-deoxyribosyltransferase
MKVYLSGGMYSGWQEKAKGLLWHRIKVLNPCESGQTTPAEYTLWDIEAVKNADALLVYFEDDNPSGIGLSLEMGIAVALGIPVILVDDMNDKRTQILRQSASLICADLDQAAEYIKAMAPIYI